MISKDYIVNLEQGSYIYSYPEYHSRYNSIHGPASWRGGPFEGFTWERCHKSFYGGVYGHLTAAVNLLATMRIGVLDDGDDEEVWRRVAREEREVSNSTDSRPGHHHTAEAA